MIENIHITKKQFLEEHNKLSPSNLKATFALLTRFQQEEEPNLKDDHWSMYKLRPPFIIWLLAPSRKKKGENNQPEKKNHTEAKPKGYRNYPETKFKS